MKGGLKMTYSKPKVTLEKYTLDEPVMADFSSPVIGENDPTNESVANKSVTLNAFGEVLDFSK